MCICALPNYLRSKTIHSKNFIQDIYPDVCVGVPIAMEEDGAGGFEDAVHFLNAVFQPADVVVDAARELVLETAYFAFVAPNYFIRPVAEKGRVEVNQINGFGINGTQNFSQYWTFGRFEEDEPFVHP